MASNEKSRPDFRVWQGVPYVIDATLPPDTFHFNALTKTYHIGAGTDLHARLFWIKLTAADRRWLKSLKIDPDR